MRFERLCLKLEAEPHAGLNQPESGHERIEQLHPRSINMKEAK
jgi:hypothetical protein